MIHTLPTLGGILTDLVDPVAEKANAKTYDGHYDNHNSMMTLSPG